MVLYDLDSLRTSRDDIAKNLKVSKEKFEEWLKGENERLTMYDKEIAKAEAVIELHGEDPKKHGDSQ